MSNDINFSEAEKNSYVYVDDKYAKLAVTANGRKPNFSRPENMELC